MLMFTYFCTTIYIDAIVFKGLRRYLVFYIF